MEKICQLLINNIKTIAKRCTSPQSSILSPQSLSESNNITKTSIVHSIKFRVSKGVTLIELTIVMLLFGIIGTIAGDIIYYAVISTKTSRDSSYIAEQGRLAIELMSRDFRIIRSNSAGDLFPNATWVGFYNSNGTGIIYSYSGSTLTRGLYPAPAQPLVQNVTSFNLYYFDQNGSLLASPVALSVYYIAVLMTLQKNDISLDFRTVISPRNF